MNAHLIRIALGTVVAFSCAAASAAPQILQLGEADKRGAVVYSVKCENGSKKILQCVRDDQHCGYAGDAPLTALVEEACGAKAPAASAPAPSDESLPFETSPAYP